MSFEPAALRALGGKPPRRNRPVTAAYLVRLGLAAGLGAAICDLGLLLLAQARGWQSATPEGQPVRAMGVVLVCLLVGALAALGSYAAARVTKHPALWVVLVGVGLLVASVQGLPRTLVAMHLIAGVWIIGWLALAVRHGSHLLQKG
ncbi:MAG: hypothetical protein R2720_03580 [Candidatus Nanopelagicales bacterium]